MIKNKWLKRSLSGLLSSTLLYAGYFTVGNFYRAGCKDVTYYHDSKKEQNYNRRKDKIFRNEFNSKSKQLNSSLEDKLAKNSDFSLNVYVSEDLKLRFDDANDPHDNDKWASYVKDAVDVLKEYERAGIKFRVNKVIPIKGDGLHTIEGILGVLWYQKKADYNLVLVADHKKISKIKNIAGLAIYDYDIAFVTIGANREKNKKTTLHEIGHLLGLKHVQFISDGYRMFIDPFCIKKESFMFFQENSCSSLKLKKEEIETLKIIHKE